MSLLELFFIFEKCMVNIAKGKDMGRDNITHSSVALDDVSDCRNSIISLEMMLEYTMIQVIYYLNHFSNRLKLHKYEDKYAL